MAQVKINDVRDLLKDDVVIVVDEENQAVAYELKHGKYKGVRFCYIDPKLDETKNAEGEDVLDLSFQYYVFNQADIGIEIEEDFKPVIADIYIKILENCAV